MHHRSNHFRRAAHLGPKSPARHTAASASTPPTGHARPVALLLAVVLPGFASAQSRPQFLTPTPMPAPVNVAGSSSYSIALSADGLRAMVETDRAGGRGGRDLVLLQRPSPQSSFTSYGPMGFCGPHDEGSGQFNQSSQGGLYSSNRPAGMGAHDVVGFGQGTPPAVNSSWGETDSYITGDGLEFFLTSDRPGALGGKSIWTATRASLNDAWGPPAPVTSIDSANHEQSPSLTDDGLILFFSSDRGGNFDIYAAARSTTQAPFGAPVRVAELSGPNHDLGIELAQDDTLALVTVLINGRAVIHSAQRDGTIHLALASTKTLRAPGDTGGDAGALQVGGAVTLASGSDTRPLTLRARSTRLDLSAPIPGTDHAGFARHRGFGHMAHQLEGPPRPLGGGGADRIPS